MVMSVFVAVVFEVYKRQHAYILLQEKLNERKALLAAFALLDLNGDGTLSVREFMQLLAQVRPHASASARSLLFKLIDTDGSESLDSHEFLKVCDAFLLKLSVIPDRPPPLPLRVRWLPMMRVVDTAAFENASSTVFGSGFQL